MRVLVIGGTRFLGPPLLRRLVDAGHDVTIFHRGEHEPDLPATVRHIHASDAAFPIVSYPAEVRAVAPDVVVHMTAYTQADAETFVAAFAGSAGRAVVLSSQDVYGAFGRVLGIEPGPPDALPITEESPLRTKIYPYRGEEPRPADAPDRWRDDYDKILVERVVRSAPALPATVLRLPAVYGPGDYQHRFWEFLPPMLARREAIVLPQDYGRWRWTRAYVENVAEAIALAIEHAPGTSPVYNVGEETARSTAEWVHAIGAAVGWQGEVVTVPGDALPKSLRGEGMDVRQDLAVSSARLRADLGYREPVPAADAMARTAAWEVANPPNAPQQRDYAAEDEVLRALRERRGANESQ